MNAVTAQRTLRLLLPFLVAPRVSAEELRERTVFAITAMVGGPLLAVYAWQSQALGHLLYAAVMACAGISLLIGYVVVRRRRTLAFPRLAFVSLILTLCIAMYVPNDRLNMNWVTVMPVLLIFLFGLREGTCWTALLFCSFLTAITRPDWFGGVPPTLTFWPSPPQIADFTVAFSVVFACAVGYESLRIRAKHLAREQSLVLKRALEARRRSEERLRDFTETASDWLFELDRELRVSHLSGRFEKITGVPSAEFIGRPFANALPDWESISGEETLGAHLLAREPFRDARLVLRAPDGRRLHMSLRGHPLVDETGTFTGYRATGTDMTATEEARRELRETNHALQQASKMEAVGQLTSGVAHDFNNLLTVIIGNLELLEPQLEEAGLDHEELEQARTAAERAADLTSKLLTFSRRQSLKPEPVEIHGLLTDTAKLLQRTLPESISVTSRVDTGSWPCQADRSHLESALLNLALNARDAMNGTGQLELFASNASLDEEVGEDWSVAQGDYVRIGVRDTGRGIEPEMVEHIFEPFFSTKPAGEGTGLGLSMVYGFVRQSGGGVRVRSEPGEGTTMELLLPRAETADMRSDAARSTPARRGGDRPVLVIEDETAVRNLVVSMLRRLGYAPTAAASGEEGVELFRSLQPEFVLSDVVLAGAMTGVDTVNAIRAIDPDVPALFMSGYSETVFRDQRHLPADVGLLAKPFGLTDLEDRLATLPRRVPPDARRASASRPDTS